MDNLPVILTVGINSSPDCLVESILQIDGQSYTKSEESASYCWQISNKYYSAKLQFKVCSFADITTSNFSNAMEAIILCFDLVSETFLDQLNQLNTVLKNSKPAVRMIVCTSEVSESKKNGGNFRISLNLVDTNGIFQLVCSTVEDWCVRNKFELIELTPKIDSDNYETDFEECTGIDRVKEVLSAHQWPNLVMKEKFSNSIPENYAQLQNFEIMENGAESCEGGPSDYPNDEFDLEESLNGMEQLSTLFKDLQTMKQDISSLSNDEKFKQAEKVVKTFWRAMHGDSDEFSESEDES